MNLSVVGVLTNPLKLCHYYCYLAKHHQQYLFSFFLLTFFIVKKVSKKTRPSKATHPLGLTHGPYDGRSHARHISIIYLQIIYSDVSELIQIIYRDFALQRLFYLISTIITNFRK